MERPLGESSVADARPTQRSTRSPLGRRRARLLFLITLAEVGGAQTYVAALLPELQKYFDVTVAAHGPGPLREAADSAGVRFVSVRFMRRALNPAYDLLGFLELILLFLRLGPDIVHTNSSKAGFLGRFAAWVTGVPIRLFTVHGWAFSAHTGLASLLYRWADRLARLVTTCVVCVCENERRKGLAARTCHESRTRVIFNGIEVGALPPARPPSHQPMLISVGRLKAPKDFVTLVRALALLEKGSFRALIVGEGPDRSRLQASLEELGLVHAVELVGERRDVASLLAAADVFVLASSSEGLPVSILEAMAAGLPVVATRVGGVPELVEHGKTGLLVPPGDPQSFAAAVSELLADEDARAEMGAEGYRRARERFHINELRRAHIWLYRSLLAERDSRS
jgi:glycosyltransferase involved in cell wall biosynthesis